MTVEVIPIEERYADGFHACLDSVAREKRFLAFQQAPPIASTRDFVKGNVETKQVQLVAVEGGMVIGWCDILRPTLATFLHTGTLGMGILKAYRGQGIGRRLIEAAIEKAFSNGIERVELTVFESNTVAMELYRKLGFRVEGKLERKAKIDGAYHDLSLMALFQA